VVPTTISAPPIVLPFPPTSGEPLPNSEEASPSTTPQPEVLAEQPDPTTDTVTTASVPATVTTMIVFPFATPSTQPLTTGTTSPETPTTVSDIEPAAFNVPTPIDLVGGAGIGTDGASPSTAPGPGIPSSQLPDPSTTRPIGPAVGEQRSAPQPVAPRAVDDSTGSEATGSLFWPVVFGVGCILLIGGPIAARRLRRGLRHGVD
jgi:hypothetical protein